MQTTVSIIKTRLEILNFAYKIMLTYLPWISYCIRLPVY